MHIHCSWFLRVTDKPALACDSCFHYACDAIRTRQVEPLSTLLVAAASLLRYQRATVCFHYNLYAPVKSPVMVASNVQLVCGYMETSLNTLIK